VNGAAPVAAPLASCAAGAHAVSKVARSADLLRWLSSTTRSGCGLCALGVGSGTTVRTSRWSASHCRSGTRRPSAL